MRKSLLLYKLTDKLHYPMDYSFKFSSLVIKQGHPTTIFGKISVRKTI